MEEYRVYVEEEDKYYNLDDIVLVSQRDKRKKKLKYQIAIGYATGIGLQPMLYSWIEKDMFFWRGAELQSLEHISEETGELERKRKVRAGFDKKLENLAGKELFINVIKLVDDYIEDLYKYELAIADNRWKMAENKLKEEDPVEPLQNGEREDWEKKFDYKFCKLDKKGKSTEIGFCNEKYLPRKVKDFIRSLLSQSKKEGITIGYKKGYEDACKMYNMPLNMTYEWLKDVDTSEWV